MNEQADPPDPQLLLQFESPLDADPKRWTTAEAQCLKFPERYLRKCIELNEALKGLKQVEGERAQLFDFVVRNLIDIVDNCEEILKGIAPGQDGRARDEEAASAEVAPPPDTELSTRPFANVEAPSVGSSRPEPLSEVSLSEAAASESGPPVTPSGERDVSEPADQAEESDQPAPTEPRPAQPQATERPAPATSPAEAVCRDEPPSCASDRDLEARGLAGVRRSVLYLLEELGVRRIDLLGHTYEDVMFDGRPIEDPFEIIESNQTGGASSRKVTAVLADLWVDSHGRIVRQGKVIC